MTRTERQIADELTMRRLSVELSARGDAESSAAIDRVLLELAELRRLAGLVRELMATGRF
jgi:hypothetical protein